MKDMLLSLADELEGMDVREGCRTCPADGTKDCRGDLSCEEAVARAVARRVREIVEHDECEVTTVSAYDLLPGEDRKAIAWVLEHGGLDAVEKRLMPEGMEWPRFEDGEPVRIGDVAVLADNEPHEVESMEFFADKSCKLKGKGTPWMNTIFKGQVAKSPAPKVLDADGEEIREGDVLYSVETGDYVIVDSIEPGNPWFATTDGTLQHCAKFTHRAPVLAADGKPLREGETVYDVEDEKGYPHIVTSTKLDGFGHVKTTCEEPTPAIVSIHPNRLTHEQSDTWERLEEEARQLDIDLNDTTDDYPRMSFCRDLVRRCRALAERGE